MKWVAAGGVAVAAIALLVVLVRKSDSEEARAAEPMRCPQAVLAPALGNSQGMSSVLTELTLLVRNRSTSACTIPGGVILEIGRGARGPVQIEHVLAGGFGPARRRVRLPPGGEAYAGVLLREDCSSPSVPSASIELRVRAGNRRSAAMLIGTCASGTVIQVGFWQPSVALRETDPRAGPRSS